MSAKRQKTGHDPASPSSDPIASDPYRALFFTTVEDLLAGPPSRGSLLALLKAASPRIVDGDLDDEAKRGGAIKDLKLRVHPDKNSSAPRAKAAFQTIDNFCKNCCKFLDSHVGGGGGKAGASAGDPSPSASSFHFRLGRGAQDDSKWPWLDVATMGAVDFGGRCEMVPAAVAARCLHLGATIVLRRKVSWGWFAFSPTWASWDGEQAIRALTRGDVKRIKSAEGIKKALAAGRPVISTSFQLTPEFLALNSARGGVEGCFASVRVGMTHPVVIVGWKMTRAGEVWEVVGANAAQPAEVGFGQFSIHSNCITYDADLEQMCWVGGPYIEVGGNSEEWLKWPGITTSISDCDLKVLAAGVHKTYQVGLTEAVKKQVQVQVRHNIKRALSRTAKLTAVELKLSDTADNDVPQDSATAKMKFAMHSWSVSCDFIDD